MVNHRVLLVLDAATEWSRQALLGFTEVAYEQGWLLLHYHRNVDMAWLCEAWPTDAICVGPSSLVPWPSRLRAAVSVSINCDRTAEGVASVFPDEAAIAGLALEHLVGRGLQQVTTFRFDDAPFAVARERSFLDAAARRGIHVAAGWWVDEADPPRWTEDPPTLTAWVEGLPRSCGVFACCDSWARVVARYALLAGRSVPEDIAIIGVDDDWLECSVAMPPLSSVAVPWRSAGRQAADIVRQGLAGTRLEGVAAIVPPSHVVARRSTDVLAVSDELVARALSWIHEHVRERVTVPHVARAVATTRQRLERRFRNAMGRTVAAEIRRARVELARRLLATTDHGLVEVARRSGFTTAALLSVAFRREIGVAPGVYRRRLRVSSYSPP